MGSGNRLVYESAARRDLLEIFKDEVQVKRVLHGARLYQHLLPDEPDK